MWEHQKTSTLVTQLKDMCPSVSVALLNYWQHVIFWRHTIYSLGQELYVLWSQKTLSLWYWESHINHVREDGKHQKNQGDIRLLTMIGSPYILVTAYEGNAADLLLLKTSMVLNHKTDHQERSTRTDAQPCPWPLFRRATWLLYSTWMPLLCSGVFRRILLQCLAFNTHESAETPWFASVPGGPLSRMNDLPPTRGFR